LEANLGQKGIELMEAHGKGAVFPLL
jgi:hypothetical protein